MVSALENWINYQIQNRKADSHTPEKVTNIAWVPARPVPHDLNLL
jgi:hypothetical protein